MPLKKALFLVFLCFVCEQSLEAQRWYWWSDRKITTDYNTCLQGVKDTLGNWVIQPIYEDIRSENGGRYIVTAGGKMGLINNTGKYLIPLSYDYLQSITYWSWNNAWAGCFYAIANNKKGIIDTANRVMVPLQFEQVYAHEDSTATVLTGKNHWGTYYKDGRYYALPWKSKRQPDHIAPHLLSFSRKGFPFRRKYGVMGDTGNVVLKRKYSYVTGHKETGVLRVGRKGKYGFCSFAGKFYWPLVLRESLYNYSLYGHNVGSDDVGAARTNGQWGLISCYGDTLLPFKYNMITSFQEYHSGSLWVVDSAEYSGIYDHKHGWKVAMTKETIFRVKTWLSSEDSSTTGLLVTSQNGKWGAVTTNGQIILPFEYDDILSLANDEFIFRKNDSLFQFGVSNGYVRDHFLDRIRDSSQIEGYLYWRGEWKMKFLPSNGKFAEFKGPAGLRTFYNQDRTRDTVTVRDSAFTVNSGKSYGTPLPDSVFMTTEIYFRPVPQPYYHGERFNVYSNPGLGTNEDEVDWVSFYALKENDTWLIGNVREVIKQEHGHHYIFGNNCLMKSDGSVLLGGDSLWSLDARYRGSDGQLYFEAITMGGVETLYDTSGHVIFTSPRSVIDYSDNYYWSVKPLSWFDYQLVERKTGAVVTDPKVSYYETAPIWDSITVLVTEKTGKQLYNIRQRKVLGGGSFNRVRPLNLSGSCFAVKTCSGKMGVISCSGHWLLDTLYTSMTPVDLDTFINRTLEFDDPEYENSFYHHYTFRNRDTSVCFDADQLKLVSPSDKTGLQWRSCITSIPYSNVEEAVDDSVKLVWNLVNQLELFVPVEDTAALLPWHKQCITDSIYSSGRFYETSDYLTYGYPCEYCRDHGAYSSAFDWCIYNYDNVNFMVEYFDDSLLCFNEFSPHRSYDGFSVTRSRFSTVMLFNDGPHQLTLDSLFAPVSDWRNFIINTMLTYLSTHDDVTGDCHNPAGIPASLSQEFLITPEGLKLFPPEFFEADDPLILTIPWNELTPYLRADLLTRLPIHEKK